MKPLRTALTLLVLAAALLAPSSAQAAFGIHDFDVTFTDSGGASQALAGSHPYEMTTSFKANTKIVESQERADGSIKDLEIFQIPGFLGDQTAAPRCSTLDFLVDGFENATLCSDSTVVGLVHTEIISGGAILPQLSPVYNLEPVAGSVARLGFSVLDARVTLSITVEEEHPHRLVAHTRNISQILEFFGAEFTLWGVPADPAHDEERGNCYEGGKSCPAGVPPRPFLTLPRSCEGPLRTDYEVDSWQSPGVWVAGFAETHDDAVPPNPQGMIGCGGLGFAPGTEATPSSASAESSSGLDFEIEVADEGLKNPEGRAQADIAAAKLTLPAGMTANPSAAEGLGVCSAARFEAESLGARGCPGASKLGTVEAQTPLLEDHPLRGSLYLASQEDNPFGSLIALYLVVRDPGLGIFVKQAGKVEADPASGRLVTTFSELPPFPLQHVEVRLRPGPRAPLITPPACGTYETRAELTPSSGAAPLVSASTFEIDSGPGGSPCPGGAPPFGAGFEASSESNAAGRFSPFAMRITRRDGDQDITRFSATLPPGVSGKLAGVAQCPDAALAAAKGKSGRQELAAPSCPPSSRIGGVIAGAGVGTALTYVPGSLYLSGPYNGAPLSVAAIVPAVAGPFDVGTVLTRVALRLNPVSGEVEVDGERSDPIPHILAGIPLKVRDVRVFADRPEFTLNPTSCAESATRATLFGGGEDPFTSADDRPFALSSRYQAADCASLPFKPRLAIELLGGTRRGDHPALRAVLRPRPGDANLKRAIVRLPSSAFLEQGHIRTICTRVQFAQDACPRGSVYGRVKAFTPLLDEPLVGNAYLRSSSNQLPDLVFALKGIVEIEAVARIDSVRGAIRASFTSVPDAPISRVVVDMQGRQKGLIVNSTNLCARPARNRAKLALAAHNGRLARSRPVVRVRGCGGKQGPSPPKPARP